MLDHVCLTLKLFVSNSSTIFFIETLLTEEEKQWDGSESRESDTYKYLYKCIIIYLLDRLILYTLCFSLVHQLILLCCLTLSSIGGSSSAVNTSTASESYHRGCLTDKRYDMIIMILYPYTEVLLFLYNHRLDCILCHLCYYRMAVIQKEKALPACAAHPQTIDTDTELEPVIQTSSVNDTSSVNQTSPDDINTSECVIIADSGGVHFVCTTFSLRGLITEGAISDGETRELNIIKHDQTLYQSTIADGHFISDIYECLPHAMKVNEPILIQFPCQTETLPQSVTRRCLIYSNTDASESPNWKIIETQDANINFMITGEMCNLFISSFCLFGLVEYNIPVMYVDMMVFGKFYQEASTCKVTVLLTQQMDDTVKVSL